MSRTLSGIAASHGRAAGPAKIWQAAPSEAGLLVESMPEGEMARFCRASHRVRQELRTLGQTMAGGTETARGILTAQAEMAVDPMLTEEVKKHVFAGKSAQEAVREAGRHLASMLEALTDSYLRQRAEDVRAVCGHIAGVLTGQGGQDFSIFADSVLVAVELSAAALVKLEACKLRGLILTTGTATSHVALVAKGMGLPAVFGCAHALEEIHDGDVVAIDGATGNVWVRPDEVVLNSLASESTPRAAKVVGYSESGPTLTADGRRITVMANVSSPGEARRALTLGAEGIGLFRSEFLFLDRKDLPSEEEQFLEYRTLVESVTSRPVVIRTLDAGGDKQVDALHRPPEENPFLGWRGVRLWAEEERLWHPQIRALLRAAQYGTLHILIPMVSDVREIVHVRELFERARQEFSAVAGTYKLGAMIEVPSAALTADALAAEVDFFSIGTNDLVQYTLAADRGNAKTANLQDPLHPAVQRLIGMTVEAAHANHIPVAVCGDAAANPDAIPWLVKAGIDELSVPVQSLPDVRQTLRGLTTV